MSSKVVGVLSILEGVVLGEARRLWGLFETTYTSIGVQSFDYPNITFQGGYCSEVEKLENALQDLSLQLNSFEIIIDGLGYFEKPSNVVFLKVLLSEALTHINKAVNDVLRENCDNIFENYLPEKWIPHVTLAMGDLTDENLARVKNDLRGYHPYYQQLISNFHLVHRCEDTQRIEILQSYFLR